MCISNTPKMTVVAKYGLTHLAKLFLSVHPQELQFLKVMMSYLLILFSIRIIEMTATAFGPFLLPQQGVCHKLDE